MNRLLLLLMLTVLSSGLRGQDLQEILTKHYTATGQDQLSGIRSLMKTGKIVQADQSEINFSVYQKRKGKIRTEGDYQGQQFVQVCNGERAWFKASWNENGEVEELTGDELDQTRESAFIDGPLYALSKAGYDIQLMGTHQDDGETYYQLMVAKSPTRTTTYLLNMDTYLIHKTVDEVIKSGKKHITQTTYRDYKEIGPVKLPMLFQTIDERGSPAFSLKR